MAGGHDLNAEPFGLMLDQIDQETEPRRVNAVLDLLDEVQRGRLGAEQRREDCQEPERAIRSTQGRNAPPVLLHQSQEDSTRRVLIEEQVIHVHRGELADPLQEDLLPGGIRADGGQNGGEVFALIAECRLTRAGRGSASGQATDPGTGSLSAHEARSERVLLLPGRLLQCPRRPGTGWAHSGG